MNIDNGSERAVKLGGVIL